MEEIIETHKGQSVLRVKIAPHAITAMIMGIVSIAVLMLFGWAAGIVALVLRKKSLTLYNENPQNYKPSTLSFLKAAKICSIIGIIVSVLYTIFYVLYFYFIISMTTYNHY